MAKNLTDILCTVLLGTISQAAKLNFKSSASTKLWKNYFKLESLTWSTMQQQQKNNETGLQSSV